MRREKGGREKREGETRREWNTSNAATEAGFNSIAPLYYCEIEKRG